MLKQKSKFKIWLKELRLFTLPISSAGIVMGTLLALANGSFSWSIFVFTMLTTWCLHLLCNISNDYGDAIRNTDVEQDYDGVYVRYVQDGAISLQEVKRMVISLTIASCIFGSQMIFSAFGYAITKIHIAFFALGIFAVFGAIAYTNGKKPYGYRALGDASVFIFFGVATVTGAFILQTKSLDFTILIPAAALALPIVGLLNNNNIRGIESDPKTGKITIAYLLGLKKARIYQYILFILPFVLSAIYVLIHYNSIWQWLFLLALIPFVKYLIGFSKASSVIDYIKVEMMIPLCVLVFALLYGVGFWIGA